MQRILEESVEDPADPQLITLYLSTDSVGIRCEDPDGFRITLKFTDSGGIRVDPCGILN